MPRHKPMLDELSIKAECVTCQPENKVENIDRSEVSPTFGRVDTIMAITFRLCTVHSDSSKPTDLSIVRPHRSHDVISHVNAHKRQLSDRPARRSSRSASIRFQVGTRELYVVCRLDAYRWAQSGTECRREAERDFGGFTEKVGGITGEVCLEQCWIGR